MPAPVVLRPPTPSQGLRSSARSGTSRRASCRCARSPPSRTSRASTTPGPPTWRTAGHIRRLGAPRRRPLRRRARLPRARCPTRSPTPTSTSRPGPGKDAFVRVCGVDYSVPPAFVGRRVAHPGEPDDSSASPARGPRSPAMAAASSPPTWSSTRRTAGRSGSPARRADRLRDGDAELPPVDLARYDALWEVAGMSETAASELAYLSRALKAPRIARCRAGSPSRARDEGWDYEAYLAAVLAEEVSARDSHGGSPGSRRPASRRSRPSTTSTSPSRRASAERRSPTSPSSTSSPRPRTSSSSDRRAPARPTSRSRSASQAARRGHRVAFATAHQWVNRLGAAKRAGRLDDELERLGRVPLLIVDEVGYIPFDPEAAALFFALVSSRYERRSLIVSSQQDLLRLGRDLRRPGGRRGNGRSPRPPRRGDRPQGRLATACGASGRRC